MQLSPLPMSNGVPSNADLLFPSQATPTQDDFSSTPVSCPSVTDRSGGLRPPPPTLQPRRQVLSPRLSNLDMKAYGNSGGDYISSKVLDDRKAHSALRSPSDPLPTIHSGQMPSSFFDAGLTGTLSDSPPDTSPLSTPALSSAATSSATLTSTASAAQQQFDTRLGAIQVPGVLRQQEVQALSSTERKRYDLQLRVYKARLLMPSHIPLRIFTNPEECVEAARILDDVGMRGTDPERAPQAEKR